MLFLPYKDTTEDGILQTRRGPTPASDNAGTQLLDFQLPGLWEVNSDVHHLSSLWYFAKATWAKTWPYLYGGYWQMGWDHPRLRWGPKSKTWCAYKRKRGERRPQKDRRREWSNEATDKEHQGLPRAQGDRSMEEIPSQSRQKEPVLLMPPFQMPGLQNCERIHSYSLKPFSLW